MSFYVEKVKREKGVRYRIVKDITRNGKRHRSYHMLPMGTTKATAEKIRCQMALNAEYGDYIPRETTFFQDYVENIYFQKYTQYLSATTLQGYKQMYEATDGLKDRFGLCTLNEITVEALQDMVNQYVKSGKSAKTIRNHLSFISVVLKQAMIDNFLRKQGETPCAYVRIPKTSAKEGHSYTIEQVKIMLERAQQTENCPVELLIAICCLAGGLRRSELVGLRWEDIVLKDTEAYIKVQRAVVQTEGKTVVKETKTKAGKRVIPLTVDGIVYQILKKARKEHMKMQMSEPEFQGNNSVFILNHSPYTPITPMGLYKTFKRFMKTTCPDLPCYRLHDLRHTYFTICSNIEGFSELSMLATGGHSTINSTKRYQHPQLKKMLTDMEKIEEAFTQTQVVSNS